MWHCWQSAAVGRSKNQPLQTNSSNPSQALGIWESWVCFRLLPRFLSHKIRIAMHLASSGGILGGVLSKHDVLHKLIRWYSFVQTCTMPHFVVFLPVVFLLVCCVSFFLLFLRKYHKTLRKTIKSLGILKIIEPQNHGIVESWNFRNIELQNCGIIELQNFRIIELQNFRIIELQNGLGWKFPLGQPPKPHPTWP